MRKEPYGINKYHKRIVANMCPIVSPACILQAFNMLATEDTPTAPICIYDKSIEPSNSYFTSSGAIITKIIQGDKIEYQIVWENPLSINSIKLNRPYIGDKNFIFLCGGGGGGGGGSGGVSETVVSMFGQSSTTIPGAGGGGGGSGTSEFITWTKLLETDITYTIVVGLGGDGGLGGDVDTGSIGPNNSGISGTNGSSSSISLGITPIYSTFGGDGGIVGYLGIEDLNQTDDFSSGGDGGNSSKLVDNINKTIYGGVGGSVVSALGDQGDKIINCTGGGGGGASGNSSSPDGGSGGSGQEYGGGGGGGASYDSKNPGLGGISTYGGQGGDGSNGINDGGNGLNPSIDQRGFGQGGGGGGGGSILTRSGNGGNGGNGSVAMLFTFTMVCLSSN